MPEELLAAAAHLHATELIGDNLTPLNPNQPGWSGIAAAADGKLYCSPDGAWRVLRIDPATGATELIGENHLSTMEGDGDKWLGSAGAKWSGIAAGVDGTLYCSPLGASRVLLIPLGLQGTPAVKADALLRKARLLRKADAEAAAEEQSAEEESAKRQCRVGTVPSFIESTFTSKVEYEAWIAAGAAAPQPATPVLNRSDSSFVSGLFIHGYVSAAASA